MEESKQKSKRNFTPTTPLIISVYVYDENLKDKEIQSISIDNVLKKFPNSTAGRIHKDHHIRFVTCLKAFLENHFGGKVDPMNKIEEITGISQREISHIKKLYKNRMGL